MSIDLVVRATRLHYESTPLMVQCVDVASLPTLETLCNHVRNVLCEQSSLDPAQTVFEQGLLTRGSRTCGLFLRATGPRQMRTYAIWAAEENRILFYDGKGARFHETQLSDAPDPAKLKSLQAEKT